MAMDTLFSLKGKNAVIVGGSSGIGLCIAQGLQDAGARVMIAARSPHKIDAALGRLRQSGAGALGHAADVRVREQIAALRRYAMEEMGRVDILVNAQGVTRIQPTETFTEEDYDEIMDTNLKSVFFTTLAFARDMLDGRGGSILNIASLSAHRGWPLAAAYGMSKHGVAGLTRTLAAEWAARGVRVNAISPGFFDTDLNRGQMKPERRARAIERTPAGRFGKLTELAGAAVYLCSPGASFVTGAVLNVDGGYLAAGI